MSFLNVCASCLRYGDFDIRESMHLAAAMAEEREDVHTLRMGLASCFDEVDRIATGREQDQEVARLAKGLDLS